MQEAKQAYRDYLKSDKWKDLARLARQQAGNRCQVCNSNHKLEVHHRQYPETWGTEPVSYLTVLCAACHKLFHASKKRKQAKRKKKKRRTPYQITKPQIHVLRKVVNE